MSSGTVTKLSSLWMQVGEFEHVLVLVIEALCRLRATDAVHGLLVWSRDITGRRMNWIKSSVDVAGAKYVMTMHMPSGVLITL